ncbi:hypothetical protein [Paludisphaera sp.]|uniref:hypothetical protein n=1 Tax=Paludisphaera sp. TaxID=2017432 RepID=UPI00301E3FA0
MGGKAAAWVVLVLASATAAAAAEELRLPGAVGPCPAWLKDDAPFDVGTFFAQPRAEEDAAPLYLEALAEFGPDLEATLEAAGRAPVAGTKGRQERILALFAAIGRDADPADPEAVDALLAELDEGFRKLADAQRRPACVFKTGLGYDALLPHAQQARQVARAATLRAWRGADAGEIDRPIGDLEMTLRLARDLGPRGGAIVQLVSAAMDGQVFNNAVPLLLDSRGLRVEHCDRLIAAMGRHEAAGVDRFQTGVKAEYVALRTTLRLLRENRRAVAGPGGRAVDEKVTPLQAAEALDALMSPEDRRTDPRGLAVLIRAHGPWWDREREVMDDFTRTMLSPAASRYADRARLHDELMAKHLGGRFPRSPWVCQLLIPDYKLLALTAARGECYNRAARARVAIARWRLTHGGADPVDLAAACREAGLPGTPADPFGDGPLGTASVDGTLVVYSVGPDGVDDRGLKDSNLGREPLGDLIFAAPAAPR